MCRAFHWSAHWSQRNFYMFHPHSRLSASRFIAEEPKLFVFHHQIGMRAPALQQPQRCTAVKSKHSAELVLTVPAPHAVAKVLKWIPWRRRGDGSMFAAIPMEQTSEEHTHSALPSMGTHMPHVSVCRLFSGAALLRLRLQLEFRNEALSLSSFTFPGQTVNCVVWETREGHCNQSGLVCGEGELLCPIAQVMKSGFQTQSPWVLYRNLALAKLLALISTMR